MSNPGFRTITRSKAGLSHSGTRDGAERNVDDGHDQALRTMRHSFSCEIAREHGAVAALLIQYLAYCIENRGVEREGHRWFYHSISDFEKHYPYLSGSAINDALKAIIGPILIAGNYNRRRGDRTRWFRFASKEAFDQGKAQNLPVYFHSKEAEDHGLLGAVILDNIRNRSRELSKEWVAFSASAHAGRIPFTKQQILRALKTLVDKGALERSSEKDKTGAYCYRLKVAESGNSEAGSVENQLGTIPLGSGTNSQEPGTFSPRPGTNSHDVTVEKNWKEVGKEFEVGVTSAEPRDSSPFEELPAVDSNSSDHLQDEDISAEPTLAELVQENQNIVARLSRDDLTPVYMLATKFLSGLNDEALLSLVGLESSEQMLHQYRRLVPTAAPGFLKYESFILKMVEEAIVRAILHVRDSSEQLSGHWGSVIYQVALEVGKRVLPLQEEIKKKRRQEDLDLRRAEFFTLPPQRLSNSSLSAEEKMELLGRGIKQLNKVGLYDSSGRFIENYFDCHSSSLRAARRMFDLNPRLTPAHLLEVVEAWSEVYYASEDPQKRADAAKRKCSLSNLLLDLGMGCGLGVVLPEFVQPDYEELFGPAKAEDISQPAPCELI